VYTNNVERQILKKGDKPLRNKKTTKKSINWKSLTISAVIDLIVGIILILVDKLLR
jgi:hypothetical protein